MTKRASTKAREGDNQTDLFGGASAPAAKNARPKKTTRSAATLRATPSAQVIRPDALLNVRQAAARLGLSKSTLDKMRAAGKGPRYVKSTDRAVRYDPADLDAWIAARRSNRPSNGD